MFLLYEMVILYLFAYFVYYFICTFVPQTIYILVIVLAIILSYIFAFSYLLLYLLNSLLIYRPFVYLNIAIAFTMTVYHIPNSKKNSYIPLPLEKNTTSQNIICITCNTKNSNFRLLKNKQMINQIFHYILTKLVLNK